MQIKNVTRNVLIAKDVVWLDTFLGHARGLMFKARITPHVLAFCSEHRTSLHTFFVAEPIDVIFVNKKKEVCELKEHFVPYSFYKPKYAAQYIIELPAKTIRKTGTNIGDRVRISV